MGLVMKLLALFVHLEMLALSMGRAVVVLIAAGGRFRRSLTANNRGENSNYIYEHFDVELTKQNAKEMVLQMMVSAVRLVAAAPCDAEMVADTVHVH